MNILDRFSSHLKDTLARSLRLAAELKNPMVEPIHLLYALFNQKGSLAAEILNRLKVTPKALEDALLELPIIKTPKTGLGQTAEAVLTPRQKELGVAVIDVGSSTISMAVYEEGDLIHIVTLPLGSERITSDIAIGLRIDIDLAEKIKLACGRALAQAVPKKEEIDVAELGAPTRALISCRYVAEIIEARVEEMFKHVDKELKKIGKSGMLPCGVVLTGGGSKLPELTEAAKNFLKLPAALGCAIDVESITDKVNDLSFATSIGLALWGKTIEEEHRGRGMRGFVSRFQSVDKATQHIGKWFKSLLP